jgi:hypothetical protein
MELAHLLGYRRVAEENERLIVVKRPHDLR